VQAVFGFAQMEKIELPIFLSVSFLFSLKNAGYFSLLNPFAVFFIPQASLTYRRQGLW
jgi:hypothetical protein